ncbi:hypothetical protein PR202_gb11301 [Eleusine coracana subsp. coracana]|uniref:Lipoxygenase domain-containing protein n=1 Tax=Eleusine coracana subsp. coracana TaxID=191504 RepID=A0AAV5EM73_ELECO|nr:hypothetical protein PR202_gb11301 [Eleusine coracana subsp. coracana]
MDRVGPARGRQLWAVPVRRVPPEPSDREPTADAGASSKEYAMLEAGQKEADLVFIHTITSQWQTILGISLIEILSKHASDEVYSASVTSQIAGRLTPGRWRRSIGSAAA